MILRIGNPSTDNLERSYLSASYAVGVTTIVTKNTNNISTSDKLLLGEMGREKSEIVTVSNVNADKITLTLSVTTFFPHSADDAVYDLRYDTIKLYRSTTGIDGTYTFLTSFPIDVDNADKQTLYDDTTGITSYYYQVSYYNTPDSIESAFSDPIAGEGYSRDQIGSVINDVLTECGDTNQDYVTVPKLLSWANETNDDLSSQSSRPYRFLRKNPHWLLSTSAGINRVSLPEDMTFIDYIQYAHTYGGFTENPEIEIIDLADMNSLIAYNSTVVNNSDELRKMAIDPATNELILYPTPLTSQSDVITIYGWTGFNAITGLGDTIQTPNGRIYKMFLLAKFWKIRSIKESAYQALSGDYKQDYGTEIVKLQRFNKIDKGTPTGMKPDRRYNTRIHYGSHYRT